MTDQTEPTGHRARLRERFLTNPAEVSETQLLELLLTYAIPRRDVAPLAKALVDRFGAVDQVLAAPVGELLAVPGIGEQAATLIQVIRRLTNSSASQAQPGPVLPEKESARPTQAALFPIEEDEVPSASEMRIFVNDEIANSLTFIPEAAHFQNLDAFKAYLGERLPYNSASTRQRRANHIVDRFFPAGRLDAPLTFFAANCTSERDLKPAIFYHVLKAEPLAAKVADEFIWPALPVGAVDREALREFILTYLPEVGASSQRNALRSLFTTYDSLDVGEKDGNTLRFHVRAGTFEAFLYVLTSEFPQPGIYSFEQLDASPLRRWLLWEREWLRRQLYNLRDFGLVAKVSEIDTVRQFSLQYDQATALKHWFKHPERNTLILREQELINT